MQAEAIAKVKAEINSSNNNPYIQVVGQFLLSHLEQNPEDANKILNADKSIGKSLNEMRKFAETKKVNNCAILTDQEGFEIVLKYFGIGADAAPTTSSQTDLDAELEEMLR